MNARELARKKNELVRLSRLIRDHKSHLRRRDELVRDLAGDVPRSELAELAQVTPGRISQITETTPAT